MLIVSEYQQPDVLVTPEIPSACGEENTFTLHSGPRTLAYHHPSASPAGKRSSCHSYLTAENKDDKAKLRDLAVAQTGAAHASLSQLGENRGQPGAEGPTSAVVPSLAAQAEGHTAAIPNAAVEPGSGTCPQGHRVNHPFRESFTEGKYSDEKSDRAK